MLLMRDKRQALADWVRKERTVRKWSQSDLADEMGKVRGVVNKIERGTNDPTLETLESLALAFNYPITIVLKVLGFKVDIAKGDPWIETMEHKLSQVPPPLRETANRVIDGLIDDKK